MTDATAYQSWQAELAGEPRKLKRGEASAGFFETRTQAGRTAVAIWPDPDCGLMARVGVDGDDVIVDDGFCERIFSRSKAIPQDVYKAVIAGEGWPEQRAAAPSPAEAEASTENPHADRPNTPPAKHVDIADRGLELDREFAKWLKGIGGTIKTQEQADKAGEFKIKAAAIETEAKEGKRVEKEPVLEEADRLEKIWKPIIQARQDSRISIVNLIGVFLKAEKDARDKAARELADKAKEAGVEVKASKVKAGGANGGRATGLVTQKNLAFEGEDGEAKAYAQIALKDSFRKHPDVRRAFLQMAKTMLLNGLKVEGAKIVEEQVAR